MPIKVKKNKKVIKQKQKQSQRQVVNIKIGEVKKSGGRKRVSKRPTQPIVQQSVQPVQYMYQSTGSIPQFQNIGLAQPPRPNLLGGAVLEPDEVRQRRQRPLSSQIQQALEETDNAVRSADIQLQRSAEILQLGRGTEARPNILGGSFIQPEEIRMQRALTLSQPEEQSLYASFPNPETIDIDGENPFRQGIEEAVNIEPLQPEEEEPILSGSGAVSRGGGTRRQYNKKDGYGTKAQLIEQIINMNMGDTEESLKQRYPSRVKLIVRLENLISGKR